MPITLTSPVNTPPGTTWRLLAFHVDNIEAPGPPSVSAVFQLVDAGGAVIQTATWVETDFPAFIAAATAPALSAVRRAVLSRAQAAATMGAGPVT